jgi:hypothetical protein
MHATLIYQAYAQARKLKSPALYPVRGERRSGRRGEHPLVDNEVFLREQDYPATRASFPAS